ncbi:hypothetical protein [Thiolapillus sp.]|uniref:hypothetical protein n=1 Tax=Thiolapillus sp. TaxID=2017437 RepID=UPI0025DD06A0|nr:hypothetical protein [Thiolapillus sp.]
MLVDGTFDAVVVNAVSLDEDVLGSAAIHADEQAVSRIPQDAVPDGQVLCHFNIQGSSIAGIVLVRSMIIRKAIGWTTGTDIQVLDHNVRGWHLVGIEIAPDLEHTARLIPVADITRCLRIPAVDDGQLPRGARHTGNNDGLRGSPQTRHDPLLPVWRALPVNEDMIAGLQIVPGHIGNAGKGLPRTDVIVGSKYSMATQQADKDGG